MVRVCIDEDIRFYRTTNTKKQKYALGTVSAATVS